MKNFYTRGISAIEIILVIGVLGILVLIVFPSFSSLRNSQLLKASVGEVLSSIDKVRSQTLSSLNSSEYGVHFQSDKIVIFKGKVYIANDTNNETIDIATPVTITNVTLGGVSGVSGDMYFNRLSGAPSVSGTITLGVDTTSKIITMYATGVASVN